MEYLDSTGNYLGFSRLLDACGVMLLVSLMLFWQRNFFYDFDV
jgi:hypothetical protein